MNISAHIRLPKISREDAPGIAYSKDLPYWRAPKRIIDAGYLIRAVRLIGTKEEICSKCKELQAEAESWFARLRGDALDDRASVLEDVKQNLRSLRGGQFFKQIEYTAMKRSALKARSFTLPPGWTEAQFVKQSGLCALTHIPMRQDRRSRSPFMPTIDRINPKRGYEPENCRLVCFMCNAAKGAFTDAEFYRMCKAGAKVAVAIAKRREGE